MRNTIEIARNNPQLKLTDMHKLTTDQHNLLELLSAATVVTSHLSAIAIPPEMEVARDRLIKAINPVTISKKKEN